MASDKVVIPDMVNKPPHYTQSQNETIVEMVIMFGWDAVIGYVKCAAWKYRARAPYKGNLEQDQKKADWYVSVLDVLEKRDIFDLKTWLKVREVGARLEANVNAGKQAK